MQPLSHHVKRAAVAFAYQEGVQLGDVVIVTHPDIGKSYTVAFMATRLDVFTDKEFPYQGITNGCMFFVRQKLKLLHPEAVELK